MNGRKFKTAFNNGEASLNISNVDANDEGVYKCELIDGGTKIDSDAKLTVNVSQRRLIYQ